MLNACSLLEDSLAIAKWDTACVEEVNLAKFLFPFWTIRVNFKPSWDFQTLRLHSLDQIQGPVKSPGDFPLTSLCFGLGTLKGYSMNSNAWSQTWLYTIENHLLCMFSKAAPPLSSNNVELGWKGENRGGCEVTLQKVHGNAPALPHWKWEVLMQTFYGHSWTRFKGKKILSLLQNKHSSHVL